MYKHKADFIRLKPEGAKLDITIEDQSTLSALQPAHRDAIHKAIARWLVKRKRALSLPEDPEFHDVFKVAMKGAYTPPTHHTVNRYVLELAAEGKKMIFDINNQLRDHGIKPAIAGDIWSDRGVSLFGMCQYHTSEDWTIKEHVLAASPFSERHTADAIAQKTVAACVDAGLSNNLRSSVFFPVSDNAANMVAGWAAFGRGPCPPSTPASSQCTSSSRTRGSRRRAPSSAASPLTSRSARASTVSARCICASASRTCQSTTP
jgi:hypothetical protein